MVVTCFRSGPVVVEVAVAVAVVVVVVGVGVGVGVVVVVVAAAAAVATAAVVVVVVVVVVVNLVVGGGGDCWSGPISWLFIVGHNFANKAICLHSCSTWMPPNMVPRPGNVHLHA